MLNNMKYFKVKPDEYVIKITDMSLTEINADNKCDFCGKIIAKDVRVMGKIVILKQDITEHSRFSPTCLQCLNMN